MKVDRRGTTGAGSGRSVPETVSVMLGCMERERGDVCTDARG